MRRLLGRLAGFSSLSLISAVVPLLVLPVVARVGGADEWTAITASQAVGAYATSVAFVGWNTLGVPKVVAATTDAIRGDIYADAFYSRLWAATAVAPVAILVSLVIAPPQTWALATIVTISSLAFSLSVVWFAVGVTSPLLIAKYELLPRLIITVVSIPAILLTRNVMWYPIALLAASLLGLFLLHRSLFGRALPPRRRLHAVVSVARDHQTAWLAEITGNLHANAPVPIAAITNLSTSAAYASADRVYRYSLMSVVAVGNTLQGWVLSAARKSRSRSRRQLAAFGTHIALGFVGWIGLAWLGAPLSVLLFGSAVSADPAVMVWLGAAFFAVSTSTPLIRNVLLPARYEKIVLIATVSGGVIGVASMISLATLVGPVGISIGLAISEMTVLLVTGIGSAWVVRRSDGEQ